MEKSDNKHSDNKQRMREILKKSLNDDNTINAKIVNYPTAKAIGLFLASSLHN